MQVKQRCVLSPLLFTVDSDDAVEEKIKDSDADRISLQFYKDARISELLFADDIWSGKREQCNLRLVNEILIKIDVNIW